MQEIQETHVQSLGQKEPLEKEMATHSSILAWNIPWTEKPGGLQSMGSQRVRVRSCCCIWVQKPSRGRIPSSSGDFGLFFLFFFFFFLRPSTDWMRPTHIMELSSFTQSQLICVNYIFKSTFIIHWLIFDQANRHKAYPNGHIKLTITLSKTHLLHPQMKNIQSLKST